LNRRGFTLVELIVVILIVAVLAAVAIPKFVASKRQAQDAVLKRDLDIVRTAVDRYFADTGMYPQRLSRLNDLSSEYSTAAVPALKTDGTWGSFIKSQYKGPYLSMDVAHRTLSSQPNPLGGTFTNSTKIPVDPISKLPYTYVFSAGRVRVGSSATGNDAKGVPYSSY
jgi:type II secretion system protein G